MGRFFAGFVFASLLWGSAGYLYTEGHLDSLLGSPDPETLAAAESAPEAEEPAGKKRKRRRQRKRRRPAGRERTPQGNAVSGDDIDWNGDRGVDMQAGEEQLSGPEIEAGFDSVFGGIRRCLVLIPGDAVVQGKLVFGMRVGPNGRATAVNLSGPAAATTGETGSCLRKAARSIHFATFDGPEMVFRFPIELE